MKVSTIIRIIVTLVLIIASYREAGPAVAISLFMISLRFELTAFLMNNR